MKALVAFCIGAAAAGAVVYLATRGPSVVPAAEPALVGGAPEVPVEAGPLVAPEVVINPADETRVFGEEKALGGLRDAVEPDAPKSAKDQERARLEEKIESFLRDRQSARRKR